MMAEVVHRHECAVTPQWPRALVAAARAAGEDVDAGLELAETYGVCLPVPVAARRRGVGSHLPTWPPRI